WVRRRHAPWARQGQPLIDLIEMIERVVEHAPERLARCVGVASDPGRRGEGSRMGVGEAGEQLLRHEGGDLTGGIVDGESGQMATGPNVCLLEMADRIAR